MKNLILILSLALSLCVATFHKREAQETNSLPEHSQIEKTDKSTNKKIASHKKQILVEDEGFISPSFHH